MKSALVKSQFKKYGPKVYAEGGEKYRITATVRYDDEFGNGHNSFSVTADIDCQDSRGRWVDDSGGCCHDEIAKHFPDLAPVIKWHLTISDGPMHYLANTVYHATQHGPEMAWVYFEDVNNKIERHVVKYCEIEEAQSICNSHGYTMEVDAKTAKEANLEYARFSAVWPDATQAQLLDKNQLKARFPDLLAEFKIAVESLGFTY